MLAQLRDLPRSTWVRWLPLALVAFVLIGVPSDLLDTPLFGRPVDPRMIDYVLLTVTAALIGLILAIRPASVASDVAVAESQERRTIWGGFVSFLAVGCPVCNQAVVALVGTSGALAWWAPVQPVVGAAAVALLLHTLRRRLATYDLAACPLPA
ncbi:MAG: hypothetical protein KDB21_05995 [Acidimicrobiales bacterium]|nr:hypothetical protein [Acidimicrobiales bacterium]